MNIDVLLVFDQFILHHLLQVVALGPQAWDPVHHVLYQMEPVQVILHAHVESRRNRALLFITTNMEVPVLPAIRQPASREGD